jgi:large subunit ribosomal protein L7/L12
MAEEEKKEETKIPAKFASLVKSIEEMTVADLAEFVKILEDKFGVSAAAPMMMAGAPVAAGATEAAEEKTSFTVMLKDGGAQKIAVIKAVREINQDLGLVDAKNLVEAAPKEVKKDLPKDEAEEAKKKLEAAGATVELV